jgi:hypothetical protein
MEINAKASGPANITGVGGNFATLESNVADLSLVSSRSDAIGL